MKRNDCPLAWTIENPNGLLIVDFVAWRKKNLPSVPGRQRCVRIRRETQDKQMRRHLAALERTVSAQEQEIDHLRAEVARLNKGEILLRYGADDEIAAERAYVHLERMDTGIFDLHVNDRQFVLESARKITLRDFDEKGKA